MEIEPQGAPCHNSKGIDLNLGTLAVASNAYIVHRTIIPSLQKLRNRLAIIKAAKLSRPASSIESKLIGKKKCPQRCYVSLLCHIYATPSSIWLSLFPITSLTRSWFISEKDARIGDGPTA